MDTKDSVQQDVAGSSAVYTRHHRSISENIPSNTAAHWGQDPSRFEPVDSADRINNSESRSTTLDRRRLTLGIEDVLDCISEQNGCASVRVWVKAGSRYEKLGVIRGGRMLLYVKAPPKEGKANKAVRSMVADALKVPKSHVDIVRGEKGRDKTLRIVSLSRVQAAEILGSQT